MVKPQQLWALFKTCKNSSWIGDVCRALGGQDVKLDEGQKSMLETLRLDSKWHDDALANIRERDRVRKEKYREKVKQAGSEDKATDGKPFVGLTDAEALAAGSAAGLSEDVALQAFAELKANGGGYTSRGKFVKVTGENLQNALRTLARHMKPSTQAAKVTAKKPTAKEIKSAMELCDENCAAFVGCKCSKGYVLSALRERPIHPKECKGFVARGDK